MNDNKIEPKRTRGGHEASPGVCIRPRQTTRGSTVLRASLLLLPLSLGLACSSASDSGGSAEDLNVIWSEASGAPAVRILVEADNGVQETWIPAVGAHVPSTDPPGMRIARLQA
jgi:hypothetical protein